MKSITRILYCGTEDALFKKLSRASKDLVWETRQPRFSGSPQTLAHRCKASVVVLKIKKEFDLKHQQWLSRNDSSVPLIVICQNHSLEIAIHAVQYGAYDYFCANQDVDTILRKIREALLIKSTRLAKREPDTEKNILLGNDPAIQKLNGEAQKFADDRKPVLISGEAGSGKERLAYGIYSLSGYGSSEPFARYDCRTLIEISKYDGRTVAELIQSRMQHVKKMAGAGVLFLSHTEKIAIEDLQELLHRGHGAVRLIASYEGSRFPLSEEKIGTSVYGLKIPALRERKDDIPLLAEFFALRSTQKRRLRGKGICDDTMLLMQEYSWPGNIQELCNVVERMVLLEPSDILRASTWHLANGYNASLNFDSSNQLSALLEDMLKSAEQQWRKGKLYEDFVERMEKMLIDLVLPQVEYNQAIAAKVLGISRNTLRERLKS